MLSQINPVHAVSILSSILHLDPPDDLPLVFPTKTLRAFFLSFLLLRQRRFGTNVTRKLLDV
jgi:hypothetical protein